MRWSLVSVCTKFDLLALLMLPLAIIHHVCTSACHFTQTLEGGHVILTKAILEVIYC